MFAAYHALVDQFWTPFSNRRNDSWGGSLENRTRFSAEIMRRIRALAGDDFIIGLAINLQPEIEVSLSIAHMQEIIAWHDERAAHRLRDLRHRQLFRLHRHHPHCLLRRQARRALCRGAEAGGEAHAQVQAESHIRTPENADYVVASGQADMVSIVRGQIADPHLANKAQEGRPKTSGPASPATRCAGAAAIATTGSPA